MVEDVILFFKRLHCFANHPGRLCCQVRKKERRLYPVALNSGSFFNAPYSTSLLERPERQKMYPFMGF